MVREAYGDRGGVIVDRFWVMAEDMRRLGLRVAYLRADRGVSQAELAARVGWSQPDISKLERGEVRSITLRRLTLLASALGVTVGQLVDDDPVLTAGSIFGSDVVPLLLALAQCPAELVPAVTTLLESLARIPPSHWAQTARALPPPATPPVTH
jgi:transcriptional regulator with XRE-family HTH domain